MENPHTNCVDKKPRGLKPLIYNPVDSSQPLRGYRAFQQPKIQSYEFFLERLGMIGQ